MRDSAQLVRIVLFLSSTLAVSCGQRDVPTAPAEPPSFAISDASHNGGNAHFFFLPPIASQPHIEGVFDGSADPVVEICEWTDHCGTVIGRFTRRAKGEPGRGDGDNDDDDDDGDNDDDEDDDSGHFVVKKAHKHYSINWNTKECLTGHCTLNPARTYRIRILVAGVELGFADVDLVANKDQLHNVQTGEFIGLINGKSLLVKFRIERGAIHLVPVTGGGTPVASAEGGTVATADGGVRLDIPPGALPASGTPTTITVAPVAAGSLPAGSLLVPGTAFEFGPNGTMFATPLTLTLNYDPTKLPTGVPGAALGLYMFDGTGWRLVPGGVVDQGLATVRAPIAHFSVYALLIVPNTVTGTPTPPPLTVGQSLTLLGMAWSYATVPGSTICYPVFVMIGGQRFQTGESCYTSPPTTALYPAVGVAVTWAAADPGVAAVATGPTYTDATGLARSPEIIGVAPGQTIVTAFGGGNGAAVLMTVIAPLPPAFVFSRAVSNSGNLYTMASDGSNVFPLTLDGGVNTEPAVSPDGGKIAWRGGSNQVWVMNADGSGARQLTTCGYNSDPSWSPDGTRIVYHSNCAGGNDDIWVMNADGSGQTRLTSDPSSEGAPDWSPDGQWIAFLSDRLGHNDVWIMRPDGSEARFVTNDAALDVYLSWSPDARQIVHRCDSNICVSDAISATTRILVSNGTYNDTPEWSPDGATITYTSGIQGGATSIWAVPADASAPPTRLTVGGAADTHPAWLGPALPPPPPAFLFGRRVTPGGPVDLVTVSREGTYPVRFFGDGGLNTEPAITANGQRVAWRGAGNQIVVINRDGNGRQVLTWCGYNSDPTWAPDGGRIVYHSNCSGGDHVWVMNADGSGQTRLTQGPSTESAPAWSPDGQWIAFLSDRLGHNDVWVMRPDGSEARSITNDGVVDIYLSWSPDGSQIAHECDSDICISEVSGGGTRRLVTNGTAATTPKWSPDGTTISFGRSVGGISNLWEIRVDGSGLRRLTINSGDEGHPTWIRP